MTHPAYVRAKAVELRTERHHTIDEIAVRLAVSRTTVHSWVGHLPIARTSRQSDAQRRGTAANVARCRRGAWRSVNGVLTIRVCDTSLRARLQAWMDIVRGRVGLELHRHGV